MKRILAILLAFASFAADATVQTNYVYVISNIYNQVFTENVITQKVKNTHTNYYITNNVTTVNKIYNTTFHTNLSVNCDLSDAYVLAASNQADRASGYVTNASGFAETSASSATAAARSASAASSSASSAAYQRSQAAVECENALSNINARINWFDQHSGETITQVTYSTNYYYAVDSVARGLTNRLDAAETNIVELQASVGTLQTNYASLRADVNSLQTSVGTLQTNYGSLRTDVNSLQTNVVTLQTSVGTLRTDVDSLQSDVETLQDNYASLTGRLANIESGVSYFYTSPGGTTYSNIVYYTQSTANGKIAVTTVGNYYPSTEYRIIPRYGGSNNGKYWIFETAYADTDHNGLRIHYLPKNATTITATTYNAGYSYVPRDLYWQDGTIYCVIDSYNGTNWSGRISMKYKGTGRYAWPNGIYAATDVSTSSSSYTYYEDLSFVSRDGNIMGTATSGTFGYIKTEYQKIMSSTESVLWFPETYSVRQKSIVDWLSTFK